LSAQLNDPRGVTWDGEFFWVVDDNSDTVYKYTASWVYTGFSFSASSESTSLFDIVYIDGSLWISTFADIIYKYSTSGVYSGNSFSVSSEGTNPAGLTIKDSKMWVLFFGGGAFEYE